MERGDYVYHEIHAVKKWDKTWGFLRNEYKKMTADIMNMKEKHGYEPTEHKKEQIKLPSIHGTQQKVSSVPFIPLKTSQDIGWRSSKREYALERFGNFGRPKGSILKHFSWPADAMP